MADRDGDGLTDEFERRIGTDPNDKDSDNDGLTDFAERRLGTKPTDRDSDGDGFDDGSEIAQRQDPRRADPPHAHGRSHPTGGRDRPVVPTADDPDADRLDEMQERVLGTKPNDPDSDGDGLGDWVESIRGTNPLSPYSDGRGDRTTDLEDVIGVSRPPATKAPAPAKPAAPSAASSIDPDVVLIGETGRAAFLDAARAQIGDPYRFGAETDLADTDPDAFDSSELVQWAAAQAGIKMPDGSWKQYQHLAAQGQTVSVEQALRTPGALVFGFSSDPLAATGRPARSYVAISLGDGKVLDVSERAGEVRELDPGDLYTHAATIPELMQEVEAGPDQPAGSTPAASDESPEAAPQPDVPGAVDVPALEPAEEPEPEPSPAPEAPAATEPTVEPDPIDWSDITVPAIEDDSSVELDASSV